jgi:single-strand DNA-binding protein
MVNKVILVGRLAADPDVRATPSGTHVTSLRVATNTYAGREEDGTRREHTELHHLVLFGRQAEVAGAYLRKGRMVYAEGRLQTRSWETDEGQRRQVTEIVAESFQMLGPKQEEAGEEPARPDGVRM